MMWLAGWRARRRQYNAALDGDTNAYLNEALPLSFAVPFDEEAFTAKCRDLAVGEIRIPSYGFGGVGDPSAVESLDVAGRPDHDNGDLADPSTTPKHRKPRHA